MCSLAKSWERKGGVGWSYWANFYLIEKIHSVELWYLWERTDTFLPLSPVSESPGCGFIPIWQSFSPTSFLCVGLHLPQCSPTWPSLGNSKRGLPSSPFSCSPIFQAALPLSCFQKRSNSVQSTIAVSSREASMWVEQGDSWFKRPSVPSLPSFLSTISFCLFSAQKFCPWYFQWTGLWLNVRSAYSFISESFFAISAVSHISPPKDFIRCSRNRCPHLLLQRPRYEDIHFLEFVNCKRKALIEGRRSRTVGKGKLQAIMVSDTDSKRTSSPGSAQGSPWK